MHVPGSIAAAVLSLWGVAAAQDPTEPEPAPPPPILRSGGLRVLLDEARGVFIVMADDGAELVTLPVGVAALPSRPRQIYTLDGDPERVLVVPSADGEGIDGAILTLGRQGSGVEVALGLRSVEAGVLVSFGVPGAAFSDLVRRDAVLEQDGRITLVESVHPRPRSGGEILGHSLLLPEASGITLRGDEKGASSAAYRLTGVVLAADDETIPGELRIESGGETLFRSGQLIAGESARFDLALEASRPVRLGVYGGRVILSEAVLQTAEGDALLTDLVVDSSQALELFAAGEQRIEIADGGVILGAIDGAELTDEVIDVRRGGPFVPPYMMIVRVGSHYLGIGLATLTDANAFAWSGGRMTLAMPTRRLAMAVPLPGSVDPDEESAPGGTIVALALLHASSRHELLAKYRSVLVEAANAGAVRATAGAANPPWWRDPIVRIGPRPPVPFDVLFLQQTSEEVAKVLGTARFTTLVDGPWSTRPGDLELAPGFETMRALVAKCHVANRHLLLAVDAFAATPGSYADMMGLSSDALLDTTDVRTHERYAKEVARRIVSRANDAIGADGIVLRNISSLRDATSEAPVAMPSSGLGLNELARHLSKLHDGLAAHFDESILLAPIALPQVVEWFDGVLVDGAATDDIPSAVETASAVIADQPLFIEISRSGDDAAFVSALAEACVLGTPILDAHRLLALDEAHSRVAVALLSIVAERPSAVATRYADGRARMALDGRVLAEIIEGRRGVVVYPSRAAAAVVAFADGDLDLPFLPAAAPDGVAIEFGAKGARIKGARAGFVYRFSL
jgi:hypothetical protein